MMDRRTLQLLAAIASVAALDGCRGGGADESSHIETACPRADAPPVSATSPPIDAPPDAGPAGADPDDVASSADGTASGASVPARSDTVTERTAAPAGVPDEAAKTRSRDAIERAYLDIYCAQRRGETPRLQAIYAEHGFSDPREWRRAWNEATRNREWLAEITQKAIETCP